MARARVWRGPRSIWNEQARKSPIQTSANSEMASVYLDMGRPALALTHCGYVFDRLDEDSSDPVALRTWITRGRALERQGRYDAALDAYRQVRSGAPDDPNAELNIGRVLGLTGRHDLALEAFLRVTRKHPLNSAGHLNAGIAFCRMSRYEEGLKSLREAQRLDPDDPSIARDIDEALRRFGGTRKSSSGP